MSKFVIVICCCYNLCVSVNVSLFRNCTNGGARLDSSECYLAINTSIHTAVQYVAAADDYGQGDDGCDDDAKEQI